MHIWYFITWQYNMYSFCLISMKVSSIPLSCNCFFSKSQSTHSRFKLISVRIRRRKFSRWIFSHEVCVTNNGTVFSPLQNMVDLAFFSFFLYTFCIMVNFYSEISQYLCTILSSQSVFFKISVLRHHIVISQYNVSENYCDSIFGFDVKEMRKL
jgi:hypothetical protein